MGDFNVEFITSIVLYLSSRNHRLKYAEDHNDTLPDVHK